MTDYQKATNAAYEILQDYDGRYPQIDIFHIVDTFPQVRVHTYTEIAARIGVSVYEFMTEFAESEMGYTVFDTDNNRWLIFYNDQKSETTIRFTIAHELGHIVLNHAEDTPTADKEANCFARNILCPVPIRDEFGLTTLSDYCFMFDISDKMAQVVKNLNNNDSYYITHENYALISANVYAYFAGYTPEMMYGY